MAYRIVSVFGSSGGQVRVGWVPDEGMEVRERVRRRRERLPEGRAQWSARARREFTDLLVCNFPDPMLLTLTGAGGVLDGWVSFSKWSREVRRRGGAFRYLAVREVGSVGGGVHYHVVVDPDRDLNLFRWGWDRVCDSGHVDGRRAGGSPFALGRYLSKDFDRVCAGAVRFRRSRGLAAPRTIDCAHLGAVRDQVALEFARAGIEPDFEWWSHSGHSGFVAG